jgi:hypothetical protein
VKADLPAISQALIQGRQRGVHSISNVFKFSYAEKTKTLPETPKINKMVQ